MNNKLTVILAWLFTSVFSITTISETQTVKNKGVRVTKVTEDSV
jgi:FtsH-binding integral membrane protein